MVMNMTGKQVLPELAKRAWMGRVGKKTKGHKARCLVYKFEGWETGVFIGSVIELFGLFGSVNFFS